MLLKKLCYVSSSWQDLSSEELLAILTAARVNNARVGVTGMLLYHDGVSEMLRGSLLDEDYLAHPDKARKLMLGFKKQLR